MFWWRRLLIVLFLSTIVVSVQAGESEWSVTEVVELSTLTQRDEWIDYRLSPNGLTLAWSEGRQLCLLAIATTLTTCRTTPRWMYLIDWSPNNQNLLLNSFEESGYSSFWVYETLSDRFFQIAGNVDRWSRPIWHPSGTELFIARRGQTGERLLLYRHSLLTGEQERIASGVNIQIDFDRVPLLTVSPDGTRIILHANHDGDYTETTDGLWLVDVTEERVEKLATLDDLLVGLPNWFEVGNSSIRIGSAAWNMEANLLFVAMISGIPQYHTVTVTGINLETGELLPLRDYRDLPEPASEERDRFYQYGFGGDITPDGELFIYYDNSDSSKGDTIYALPLFPNTSEAFIVSEDYYVACGPERFLLITSEYEGETRRYAPKLGFLCPG